MKKDSWVRRLEVQFNVVNVSVRLLTNWIAVCQSPCLPSCFPVDALETARPFPELLPAKAGRTRGTMLFCGRAAEECWGGVILQGWSEFSFHGTVDGHFIRLISWDAKYPAIYTVFVSTGEHQILSISWFFQYGWYQAIAQIRKLSSFLSKKFGRLSFAVNSDVAPKQKNSWSTQIPAVDDMCIKNSGAGIIGTFASRHF